MLTPRIPVPQSDLGSKFVLIVPIWPKMSVDKDKKLDVFPGPSLFEVGKTLGCAVWTRSRPGSLRMGSFANASASKLRLPGRQLRTGGP
jgi:hypothetical protein